MKEDHRIKSKKSLEKTGNIETEASVLFNRNTSTTPTWIHVQNHVENHDRNRVENHDRNRVQNRVQKRVRNHVREIKNIVNKNMSFLKITDPKKIDFIVNEFLKTRQNIQQNFLSVRLGDVNIQYELSKLFKPVTDMQKDLKEGHVSELKTIREGMKNLPKTIILPQFPSITAYEDDDGEEDEDVFIVNIAEQYLERLLPCLEQIRHCGIRMVSFILGTRKQK